jgi:flagellar motility protein MotE (MotC chaperone)
MAAAPHRRLLPVAMGAMGVLLAVKLTTLVAAPAEPAGHAQRLVGSANAAEPRPAQRATNAGAAALAPSLSATPGAPSAPGGGPPAQCGPDAQQPTPEQRAERELLQALRARRAELDSREQALLTREVVAEAAERRAAQRLEEAAALQRQAATADHDHARDRERSEREEAGWRQMVKLYEGVRPREAAAIFDELDLSVLVPLVDRLRESKAAPIIGAMRPERARTLTAELARHRSRARD